MTIDNSHPSRDSAKDETSALAARVRPRLNRPLVLVGMMGVGKSTIGRKLGQMLNLSFADADEEIERAAQMPISEMFERFGEAHFRDGERRVIARLMDSGPSVIATGGGAFVQPETQALILDKGLTIWLDCDVATLVDRVTRKDTRPLLRGGNPREIVARLKAEREPAYARAAIHVQSDTGPHSETVHRILQGIDQWL
ncbi:MAG: shikimate kinase [Croceibacterium sp.]